MFWFRPGSKPFDTLIVFLKEFFEKVNFEKSQQRQQKHEKLPSMQEVDLLAKYRFSMLFRHQQIFKLTFTKKKYFRNIY